VGGRYWTGIRVKNESAGAVLQNHQNQQGRMVNI
jgi:hypothetical protein